MIRRSLLSLVVAGLVAAAVPASAQTVGTFQWQLAPYGSVLNLTVVQQGTIYLLDGFEAQCGGNASLPVSGVGIVQANGQVFLGLTSITVDGRGLHTSAFVNLTNFNGSWSDNANNSNRPLIFNPGDPCPLGPRTGPMVPDQDALAAIQAELDQLRARVAAAESARKQ